MVESINNTWKDKDIILNDYLEWVFDLIQLLYEEAKEEIRNELAKRRNIWVWIWTFSNSDLIKLSSIINNQKAKDWLTIAQEMEELWLLESKYIEYLRLYLRYENLINNPNLTKELIDNPEMVNWFSGKVKIKILDILDIQ